MNKLTLMGRLVAIGDLTFAKGSGMAFYTNTIAIDNGKDKEATFVRIKAFGKVGEAFANWTDKGSRVLVEGHLQSGSYEKDGKKVYTMDNIVDKLTIIDFKDKDKKIDGDMTPTTDGNVAF